MAKNARGQSTSLSTVLVLALVIVLVLTTYVWGNSLLESQQARTNANYMQSKLLVVKRNVLAVTHEGPGATRTMSVNLGEGSIQILEGDYCPDGALSENSQNGVVYEMFSKSRIIIFLGTIQIIILLAILFVLERITEILEDRK